MNSAVKTAWKKAASVRANNHFRLHLTMEDGEKLDLDLTPLINSREAFCAGRGLQQGLPSCTIFF
jgi:hypothetical protein